GNSWWFCGDWERGNTAEAEDELAAVLGRLLQRWDAVHPGIEWLARDLRLPVVGLQLSPPTGADQWLGCDLRFDLRTGGRLGSLPPGHVVRAVYLFEVDPLEEGG